MSEGLLAFNHYKSCLPSAVFGLHTSVSVLSSIKRWVKEAIKVSSNSTAAALIEEHTPLIAAAWRRLERLLTEFHNEIRGTATVRKNELPVLPVEIYPPKLFDPKDPDSEVIALKRALPLEAGRIAAAEAYAKVSYTNDEPANESVVCYGVIGVPLRLIQLAKSVNQAKDELRAAIAPLAQVVTPLPVSSTGVSLVLPNGVKLEFHGELGSEQMQSLVTAASRLP